MKHRISEKMKHLTPTQKKVFTLASTAILIVFGALVTVFIGGPMLKFVEEPELFRAWVDSHGIWGRLTFVGMMIFQVIFAVIPGEPLEIGAGYAFGAIEGTALCLLATTAGSMLVFFLVKKIGVRLVEVFFSLEKINSLWFLRTAKRRNALIFLVFFIPGTPKDLLCYVVGLTDIQWQQWLLISLFARIPSVITSTIGGNALGQEQYTVALVAFGVTAAVSIGGFLIYQRIIKPKQQAKKEKNKK